MVSMLLRMKTFGLGSLGLWASGHWGAALLHQLCGEFDLHRWPHAGCNWFVLQLHVDRTAVVLVGFQLAHSWLATLNTKVFLPLTRYLPRSRVKTKEFSIIPVYCHF